MGPKVGLLPMPFSLRKTRKNAIYYLKKSLGEDPQTPRGRRRPLMNKKIYFITKPHVYLLVNDEKSYKKA